MPAKLPSVSETSECKNGDGYAAVIDALFESSFYLESIVLAKVILVNM
jgi:hypothetical protein